MDSGATRFALGIMVLLGAMVLFFFAFHPGGVAFNGANVSNPGQILQWLIQQFSGGTPQTLSAQSGSALNYPGYTTGPAAGTSNTGNATPQAV